MWGSRNKISAYWEKYKDYLLVSFYSFCLLSSAILILLGLLNLGVKPFNRTDLIGAGTFLGLIAFLLWFRKFYKARLVNSKTIGLCRIVFWLSLSLSTLTDFISESQGINWILIPIAIMSGIVIFESGITKSNEEKDEKESEKIDRRTEMAALLAIALWGGFVRFFHIGKQSLWIDEIYSFDAINAILRHGLPVLKSGALYYREILYSYLVAGITYVWGSSETTLRLLSGLIGTISIIAFYFILKRFFSRYVSLFGTYLFSALYVEITYSRMLRFYIFSQFLFLIFWLIYSNILKKKSIKSYIWLMLVGILCITVSNTNLLLIGPAILVLLVRDSRAASLIYWLELLKKYKYYVLTFLGLSLFYGTFYFDIQRSLSMIRFDPQNISYLFNFIAQSKPFLIILILSFIYSFHSKRFRVVSGILALNLIVVGLIYPVFFDRYIFTFFWVLALILVCFGLQIITRKRNPIILLISVVIFSKILVFAPQTNYYMDSKRIAQPDYSGAYSYIYSMANSDDTLISVSSGALHSYYVKDLPCDRVFMFYNTDDANFESYRDWAQTSLTLWTYKDGDGLRDVYDACEIITSKNDFYTKFVNQNARGRFWFIVDKKQYLDPLMQDIVYDYCAKREFYQVYVYSCDKEFLLSSIANNSL